MSNHAKVITKEKMTPEGITDIIDRLNKTRFLNTLIVKNWKGGKGDWGKHVWLITIKGIDNTAVSRECWLNNDKSFEMRHGGGGNFAWWIDFSITNEVALIYNGITKDDADGDKVKPEKHKYDSWSDFTLRMNFDRGLPVWELEWTPKEFHNVKTYDVTITG